MLLRCRIPLPDFALDLDASFDARVTSIFGPSGSGKTTILDAIAGLIDVTEGEIEIDGRILFSSARGINLSPQQRFIGYVPQEGGAVPASIGSAKCSVRFESCQWHNPKGKNRDRSRIGCA